MNPLWRQIPFFRAASWKGRIHAPTPGRGSKPFSLLCLHHTKTEFFTVQCGRKYERKLEVKLEKEKFRTLEVYMSRTCLFQNMNVSLRMPQIHASPASPYTASWLPRYIERGITMVVSSLIFRLKKCGNSKPNPNVFSNIKENWHLYIVMCKHCV